MTRQLSASGKTLDKILEDEITRRASASGIRLRFDRVALRLLDEVKTAIAPTVPVDQSIAYTITAPIRLPAKTSTALQAWLHHFDTHNAMTTIHGNTIHARRIDNTAPHTPKLIGLVHNRESNAHLALDIVERTLHEHPPRTT